MRVTCRFLLKLYILIVGAPAYGFCSSWTKIYYQLEKETRYEEG